MHWFWGQKVKGECSYTVIRIHCRLDKACRSTGLLIAKIPRQQFPRSILATSSPTRLTWGCYKENWSRGIPAYIGYQLRASHVTRTGRSRPCSRRRRPWRSTCRWGGRGSRSTWDSASATTDPGPWEWIGRRSAPYNQYTSAPTLHARTRAQQYTFQSFSRLRSISPAAANSRGISIVEIAVSVSRRNRFRIRASAKSSIDFFAEPETGFIHSGPKTGFT